jgi:hypothetical protein
MSAAISPATREARHDEFETLRSELESAFNHCRDPAKRH